MFPTPRVIVGLPVPGPGRLPRRPTPRGTLPTRRPASPPASEPFLPLFFPFCRMLWIIFLFKKQAGSTRCCGPAFSSVFLTAREEVCALSRWGWSQRVPGHLGLRHSWTFFNICGFPFAPCSMAPAERVPHLLQQQHLTASLAALQRVICGLSVGSLRKRE